MSGCAVFILTILFGRTQDFYQNLSFFYFLFVDQIFHLFITRHSIMYSACSSMTVQECLSLALSNYYSIINYCIILIFGCRYLGSWCAISALLICDARIYFLRCGVLFAHLGINSVCLQDFLLSHL